MNITFKKLGSARTQATVVFEDAVVTPMEEEAVRELAKDVNVKGFRPGQAPLQTLREHLSPDRVHETVVQKLMPDVMNDLVSKHELKPIIRPRVELNAISPFTLNITVVEEPSVKVEAKKIQKEIKMKQKDGEDRKRGKDEKADEKEVQMKEEQIVLDALAKFTKVELAPELIDDEVQDMAHSHAQRLSQFGMNLEDWLQSQQKSIEDFVKELRPDAEKRLKIRFGVTSLITDWKIEVTDEEMKEGIDTLLKPLEGKELEQIQALYKKGERAYEQFTYQKKVEKVLQKLKGN